MKIKDKKEIKQTETELLKHNETDIVEWDMTDLLRKQRGELEEAINARQEWQAKQNKWYRQRYGLRNRATFPWYNASSQHLPMQDSTIRKLKPEYVSVGYNVAPMCEISTQGEKNVEVSEAASWHFDWLLRTRIDVFEPMVLMVDTMLHRGFAIVKTIYSKEMESKVVTIFRDDLEKEILKKLINKEDIDILTNQAKQALLGQLIARQYALDMDDMNDAAKVHNICAEIYKGTEAIEFMVEEKIYDAPKWIVLEPEEIVVPQDTVSVFDLEKANWICHRYYITPQEALKNSLIGKWDKEAVDSLLAKSGVYDQDLKAAKYKTTTPQLKMTGSLDQRRRREGLGMEHTTKSILINEFCLWFDSDGDGIEERHILEFADGSEKTLRFIRYPYAMRMWPYVKIIFELAETRHYSNRGTVEIEEPLAVSLNVQHNMKINRQTIASTPTLLYVANKINPYNMQYIPGQPVPVEAPINNNAQWFMPPNTDATFMQEEATLKNWDNEYMAVNDFGLVDETATKTKVNASARVGIRTLDIQIFQKGLKELYKRTAALWMEFNSEEQFTFVDSDGTTHIMDKAAFSNNPMFQPMGSFGSSNPQLAAQIASRMFEEYKGDPMVDQYELYREHMLKQSDMRTMKRLLKTKEQIGKDQQAAQQAQDQEFQKQVALAQAGVKIPQHNSNPGRNRAGMQQIGRLSKT